MVSHIETRAGRLVVKVIVSRSAGVFEAAIPMSATPVELELFCVQLKAIHKRRKAGEGNSDPDAS